MFVILAYFYVISKLNLGIRMSSTKGTSILRDYPGFATAQKLGRLSLPATLSHGILAGNCFFQPSLPSCLCS